MSNSVERFSDRVEDYVRYRPGYPNQILDILKKETGFSSEYVIADIGSGTGISAKLFLENGNHVIGVEPNRNMRNAAEIFLSDYAKFKSSDGSAHETGLADKSVDLITAFQSFHWFNNRSAQIEFGRILRPGGFLVLIWNERCLNETDFFRDYESFLIEFGNDYEDVRHDQISKEEIEQLFGERFEHRSLPNSQSVDFEGFKGRTLSASYMPKEVDIRFGAMIKKLQTLFARYEEKGRIKILYTSQIYYGQI